MVLSETPIVIVPGWQDSGPEHWQSRWQRAWPQARRIAVADWLHPDPDDWVEAIDRAVRECVAPPVLVAHSLGCIAIARWSAIRAAPARAAWLVAPADVERAQAPPDIAVFAPISRLRLRFPACVVASHDDPFVPLERARGFAAHWGAEFLDLGDAGHINAAAGYGPWPDGLAQLSRWLASFAETATETSA